MSAEFNVSALDTFKNNTLADDNSIANINDKGEIVQNGTFSKSNIFRWMRSGSTQANNNNIRTQLLQSLGKSFGLESGITTGKNGAVTFSGEFMNKLEKLLGPSFKKADFGISDAGGAVSSGKPLTSRRINEIVTKAMSYNNSSFSVEAYKNKLSGIMNDYKLPSSLGMSNEKYNSLTKNNSAAKIFGDIEKCLDFLDKNKFDQILRVSPEYDLSVELGEEIPEDMNKFDVYDDDAGKFVPLKNNMKKFDDKLWKILGGELIHTERAKFDKTTSTDLKPLKNYIETTIKSFVKNTIDAYYESKMNGQLNQFNQQLEKPGACMEDKGKTFFEYRQNKLQGGVKDVKLEAELDLVVNRNQSKTLKQRIEDELNFAFKKTEGDSWKDYADTVKQSLVGKTCEIIVPEEDADGNTKYVNLLDENGNKVVRPVTEADIDKLGEALYDDILMG